MPMIPFGEWLPDAAALGNPGALRAANCFPGPTGYKPAHALQVTTNALDARPRGAISVFDKDGNVRQYAGDAAKLYELSGQTWGDKSIATGYATATGERWEFALWKNKILATNYSNNPQQSTMGAAAFSNLTTAFRARTIAVVKEHVVMGNTTDGVTATPNKVEWSATDDETDWSGGATVLQGSKVLPSGGEIKRIIGREYGTVFCQASVFRMAWVGSPTVFQFDEVLAGIGILAPGAVASQGNVDFFASTHGFRALEFGTRNVPIGAGKVDKFFADDLDLDHLDRIVSAADPLSGRVLWAYPGAGNVSGLPNRALVYDPTLNRWSLLEIQVEFIWPALGAATTLEGLDSISADLDALETSLDASRWKGGGPALAGFDSAKKSGFFDGSVLDAEIDTAERELIPGRRAILSGVRVAVDGGTSTVTAATRNAQSEEPSFGTAVSARDSGKHPIRTNARYHRFRVNISGDWTDAIGIDLDREDVKTGAAR